MTNNEQILTHIVLAFYNICDEHCPTIDVNKIIDDHLTEFNQNDIDRVREMIFDNRLNDDPMYF